MSYTYCGARLRECVEECEANSDMNANLFRCEAREEREANYERSEKVIREKREAKSHKDAKINR